MPCWFFSISFEVRWYAPLNGNGLYFSIFSPKALTLGYKHPTSSSAPLEENVHKLYQALPAKQHNLTLKVYMFVTVAQTKVR